MSCEPTGCGLMSRHTTPAHASFTRARASLKRACSANAFGGLSASNPWSSWRCCVMNPGKSEASTRVISIAIARILGDRGRWKTWREGLMLNASRVGHKRHRMIEACQHDQRSASPRCCLRFGGSGGASAARILSRCSGVTEKRLLLAAAMNPAGASRFCR